MRTLYLGVLEHTPQISCQLCNLVCFGAHFPLIFSKENIYKFEEHRYVIDAH